MQVKFEDLKSIEYKNAWDYQETIFKKIVDEKLAKPNLDPTKRITQNTILFCEHPHVYTLGKSGVQNNLLVNEDFLRKIDATFFKSNRGGDITYHGPGQIVGYPIVDLEKLNLTIRSYIFKLEEAIIHAIAKFDINGTRLEGAIGVWLDVDDSTKARKICAIGVKAGRMVTMHGFALNVNTDLTYYRHINPCGFTDKGVTSMEKELCYKLDFEKVKHEVKKSISEMFEIELIDG